MPCAADPPIVLLTLEMVMVENGVMSIMNTTTEEWNRERDGGRMGGDRESGGEVEMGGCGRNGGMWKECPKWTRGTGGVRRLPCTVHTPAIFPCNSCIFLIPLPPVIPAYLMG